MSGVGAAFGFYDDVTNQDKTYGEAFAHNAAVVGVGFIPVIGTAVFVGTPVGWAAVGLAATGTGIAIGFNAAYHNNLFGLQTGLDAVGRGLDSIAKGVWGLARNPGEAIQNGANVVNEQIDGAGVYVQNTADNANDGIQSGVNSAQQTVEGLGRRAQQDAGFIEGYAIDIGVNVAGEAIEYVGNELQRGVVTANEVAQAGLDFASEKLERTGVAMSSAGQAVKDGINTINPMNWSWGKS